VTPTKTYSRLTYWAWGKLPDEQRAVVHEQCTRFGAALEADRGAEHAAEAFPPNAREAAARAATAIRAFESAIGRKTGARPYLINSFSVGMSGHFEGSRTAAEAANDAANALEDLLKALGATDVGSSSMD